MGTCQTYPKVMEEKVEVIRTNPKPDPKNYLRTIIKLQAFVRGQQARKTSFTKRLGNYNDRITKNLNSYGHNYNANKGIILPPFDYNYKMDNEDLYFEYREFRPATQFANGGIYKGEW